MKKLTLIVHTDIEQPLADLLRSLPQVSDFIFTQVEAHGAQDERDHALSARDRVVGYTPHVRVDLILTEADIETVLTALRASPIGIAGRGVYWVTPVTYGRL